MRFLEALLVAFAAIYVVQLAIAALMLASLLLFLCCLFHRPREALILGLAVLGLAALTRPLGMALVSMFGLGLGLLCLIGWMRRRRYRPKCRPIPLLQKLRDDAE